MAEVIGTRVVVKGELKLQPTYQPSYGNPDNLNGSDRFQQTTAQHERYHGLFAKSFWNENLARVDYWEGDYCTEDCAKLAEQLAEAWNRHGEYRQYVRQYEYDDAAYGDLDQGPNFLRQRYQTLAERELANIRTLRDRFVNQLRCYKQK